MMPAVKPSESAYFPASLVRHAEDPVTGLYLPRAHGVQLVSAVAAGKGRKVPAGQLTQENGEFWPERDRGMVIYLVI